MHKKNFLYIFFQNGDYDVFFFKTVFFKSAGSISQTIFIQSTWNFAQFFVIRLSSEILTSLLTSLNYPTYSQFMTIFFLKNTNFDFNLTQIY